MLARGWVLSSRALQLQRFPGATFFSSLSTPLSGSAKSVDEEKGKSIGHKAMSFVLITVTGGVALSAVDDLVIYHGCSSKAMESQ